MAKSKSKKNLLRRNNDISESAVRVVGDNVTVGIYSIREALNMADEMDLDLVEINRSAKPTICKIIDYKKYIFEQKKHQKQPTRSKTKIKEIRFGPNTDKHDIDFKRKHAESFLSKGHRLKAYVFFKGREIVFKEKGELLLLQFAESLKEVGSLEKMPVLEGKRMVIWIIPKKYQ